MSVVLLIYTSTGCLVMCPERTDRNWCPQQALTIAPHRQHRLYSTQMQTSVWNNWAPRCTAGPGLRRSVQRAVP